MIAILQLLESILLDQVHKQIAAPYYFMEFHNATNGK